MARRRSWMEGYRVSLFGGQKWRSRTRRPIEMIGSHAKGQTKIVLASHSLGDLVQTQTI